MSLHYKLKGSYAWKDVVLHFFLVKLSMFFARVIWPEVYCSYMGSCPFITARNVLISACVIFGSDTRYNASNTESLSKISRTEFWSPECRYGRKLPWSSKGPTHRRYDRCEGKECCERELVTTERTIIAVLVALDHRLPCILGLCVSPAKWWVANFIFWSAKRWTYVLGVIRHPLFFLFGILKVWPLEESMIQRINH